MEFEAWQFAAVVLVVLVGLGLWLLAERLMG